jgi:hypothetical protein
VLVAQGQALVILPYSRIGQPTELTFQKFGQLVAIEVVGVWYWVTSIDGKEMKFLRKMSHEEVAETNARDLSFVRIDRSEKYKVAVGTIEEEK